MKQRGRKGSKGNVVQLEPKRPPPPPHFTAVRTEIWHSIVNSLPGGYFTTDVLPLLESYCVHIDLADQVDKQVDAAFEKGAMDSEPGMKYLNKLMAMRERQTSTMLSLARSLRLTQQSRYRPEKAAIEADKGGDKPWE